MKEALAVGGMGCAMVLFFLALSVGISCGMGVAASWVLGHFGVKVAWYVCSVALFLLGTVFKSGRSK